MNKVLLINSWFGDIPDYYKFHEKTMQFQNENIDMFFLTDQDVLSKGLSKNYHIHKISEDNIKYRFFLMVGKKYTDTLIGKTTLMKLMFLNNFFEDIIDYSKYDYVGIYDTDTLFGNIYEWVSPFLGKKDFISVGGGKNHNRLSGPLCIFRKNKEIMSLFETEDYYNNVLKENVDYLEHQIDQYAKSKGSVEIIQHCQNVEHETSKIFFDVEWRGGKVFCQDKEILLHHFYRKNETSLNFHGNNIISTYKKHFDDDFYWVTSFDEKYENQVLTLIESIKKFSNRKCILFSINYEPRFQYNLSEQFIIRRIDIHEGKKDSRGRDYNFLVSKPLIDIECIKILPFAKFVHIDTDVILTLTCDDVINNSDRLSNYPLYNSHTHDELIIPSGVGDVWVNPIRILAEQTGDPIRVYPRRKTNMYLFDKNSIWFFEEQMNIFNQYYEKVPHILHFHDEDTANILLNRFNYKECLPLIDIEESETLDLQKLSNYSYSFDNPLSDKLKLPKTQEDILMFHGHKDKDKRKKILENYCTTLLLYDDIVTYIKGDTIWFEKNSTLTNKKILDILDFFVLKNGLPFAELRNQKIFNFWYFYIGGLNFNNGDYTCLIRETETQRLVFKKKFII